MGKKKVVKKVKKKIVKKKKAKIKVVKKKVVKPKSVLSASLEEIGVITHYFPHVEAAVVKITKGTLKLGDSIMIKGHTTDLKERIDSMQLDHAPIEIATRGQEIGLRVKKKVREHDVVYKVVG
ncbi:MAG: hypothetical protein ABH848_05795 [Candidatus Omnitrophota bacterium]